MDLRATRLLIRFDAKRLAAPLYALRTMVSEASTPARQHFATGTIHLLKPSIEAAN
jgi:ethanolamine utilization cobalamin adenosyltransferase